MRGSMISALAPFREKGFGLYQVSRLLLITAGQIVFVALGWHVYSITGSLFHLGMIGFAQFLPNLLLSLFGGHAADRLDRRRIVMACALASAATAGLLAWGTGLDSSRQLVLIYVACALMGTLRAFSAPAGHAFLPALVPASLLRHAVVLHLTIFQIATVIGPMLGGYVYREHQPSRVYGVATALYIVAFVGLSFLEAHPKLPSHPEPFRRAVGAGLRHVWKDKRLLGAMSLDLFAVLLGGATALLPAIVKDILHAGPEVLGFLRSSQAAGAGLVALLLAFRPLGGRIGAWLFAGVAVFGLATVGLGLSRSLPLTAGFLAIAGAADMLSVTVRHTLIQVATPDAMRGRVSAVSMVFINASNELGEFESGVTAHWWGTPIAVVVGGAGTVAVVLLWMALFPSLRKADKFEDGPELSPARRPDEADPPERP